MSNKRKSYIFFMLYFLALLDRDRHRSLEKHANIMKNRAFLSLLSQSWLRGGSKGGGCKDSLTPSNLQLFSESRP